MTRKCSSCYDLERKNHLLETRMDAICKDSIGHNAIRFINEKGLADEWARFLIDCASGSDGRE